MTPEEELDLVRKALTCGLNGCVLWKDDRTALRVRSDPANQGLTPKDIMNRLLEHVKKDPQAVKQRREQSPEQPSGFWYFVLLQIEAFPHGFFVKFILSDDDPDYPCVALVSAHPERR